MKSTKHCLLLSEGRNKTFVHISRTEHYLPPVVTRTDELCIGICCTIFQAYQSEEQTFILR